MQTSLVLNERRPWREICFPNGEWVLALALAVELAVFAAIGENFFTLANFFEVVRLSVELGLLALAMTPIMITGGIDLSVGSIMGLSAVVFGVLWRDGGWPIAAAAGAALVLGCLAGLLNAVLITRLNLPPLIVTLGSLSLFRGIAEGITRGAENYSGFPAGFLRLGQGYLGGVVPGAVLHSAGGDCRLLGAAASLGDRPHAVCDRLQSGGRALRGHSGAAARGAALLLVRRWCRVWRRSFTWRTWDRRNLTPARDTSWRPSRRSCWAALRCSAGAGRSGARSSGCSRFRCCRTDCAWPRCPRK